jgi:hypothetical protein
LTEEKRCRGLKEALFPRPPGLDASVGYFDLGEGAAAGGATGGGVGATFAGAVDNRSKTELVFGRRMERVMLVIMKTAPRMVVRRERRFAEPLGPNAVWEPPPPNALARSWPLPCWSKTTQIKKILANTCRVSRV